MILLLWEQVNLKYLFDGKDQVKELVVDLISGFKGKYKSPKCKVLDQPIVKDTLEKLHADFVLVPTDKAANNVIMVCMKYYIEILAKEIGINTSNTNSTYIPSTESFDDILRTHANFVNFVSLEKSEKDKNLPYLCWTQKLRNTLSKHLFFLLAPVNAQLKTNHVFLQSYCPPLKMD